MLDNNNSLETLTKIVTLDDFAKNLNIRISLDEDSTETILINTSFIVQNGTIVKLESSISDVSLYESIENFIDSSGDDDDIIIEHGNDFSSLLPKVIRQGLKYPIPLNHSNYKYTRVVFVEDYEDYNELAIENVDFEKAVSMLLTV